MILLNAEETAQALPWSEVIELSQLLGAKPAAEYDGFVFKSVGHASWDLAAARVVLQQLALSKAVELG